MPSNEQPSAKAEQGGQPERRLAIFLNSKPVAAARFPWTFGENYRNPCENPNGDSRVSIHNGRTAGSTSANSFTHQQV